ncbi:MAG: radical SAM protein [bacterium]
MQIKEDIAPPVLVSFAITRRCNLKCIHCYSESVDKPHPNELTTDEAKTLIDQIARSGARLLIFDGGEPLMRDDVYELIRYASTVGLRPLLGTNATLIDDDIARRLKEAGLRAMAVSLDGDNAKTHDDFRGENGSFNTTIEGIKCAIRANIPFQIGPCISKNNKGLLKPIVELARGLGAVAIEVFDFIASGRGLEYKQYELSKDERRDLVREIISFQREDDELTYRCIGVPEFWVEVEKTVPEDEVITKFVRSCCGAGIRYACIMYDGTVYPCMVLQKPAGDVREKPFDEIWRSSEVFATLRDRDALEGKCGRCSYRYVCGGTRCRVYHETGSLIAEDPNCWFTEDEITKR